MAVMEFQTLKKAEKAQKQQNIINEKAITATNK